MFRAILLTFFVSSIALSNNANAQQNIFNNIFGAMAQQQNAARWNKVSQQEKTCIDHELQKSGITLGQLINKGIPPESPNLSVIRSNCKNPTQLTKQDAPIGSGNSDEFFPDGKYLPSEAACKKLLNDKNAEFDNMLTIKGNEITGYEMGCTITSKQKTGSSFRISADCGGEGENWKVNTDLKTDGKKYNFGELSNNKNYFLCVRLPATNNISNNAPEAASSNIMSNQQNAPARTVALGTHCGSTASISQITGVDSSNAVLQASMNKEQALDSCTCDAPSPEAALKGPKLEACVQNEMRNLYLAKADCSQGVVTDTNNKIRQFTGKIKDKAFELVEKNTGQSVEMISATGYSVTMSQFSSLCPKLACSNKLASEGLDGCK